MSEEQEDFIEKVVELNGDMADVLAHAESYNRTGYEHKKQDALGRIALLHEKTGNILEEHE